MILAEIGDRHADMLERYLYIGGSRPRHHLVVLSTGDVAGQFITANMGASG